MTGKQRKSLVGLRLFLSVIAVILAGVMAASGVMHFIIGKPAPEEETMPEPTETTQSTEAQEQTQNNEYPELPVSPITKPDATESVPTTSPDVMGTAPTTEPNEPGTTPTTEPDESGTTPTTEPDESGIAPTTEPDESGIAPTTEPDESGTVPTTSPDELSTAPTTEPDESGTVPTTSPDELSTTPATSPDESGTAPTTEPIDPGTAPTADPDATDATNASETTSTTEVTAELNPTASAPTEISEPDDSEEEQPSGIPWGLLFLCSSGLFVLDLIAILVLSRFIRADKKRLMAAEQMRRRALETVDTAPQTETLKYAPVSAASPIRIGTVHQVGAREYQQDSMGYMAVLENKGMLAVVADGMGGLSNGEKVSRKIVMDMLGLAQRMNAGQANGILWKMVNQVNEDVNRMLGPNGLYKSGSTLVSVLVLDGKFQWIAIGDSRIYLYRKGFVNQLNRDHDQLQAWMPEVLEGKRSMEEVLRNPDGRKLTSFIGMGQLKHIDGSIMPIALEAGDRLILMSDGIYNIVNEELLAAILKHYPDVNQAASAIERAVKEAKHPHQDNFTAIVLGF